MKPQSALFVDTGSLSDVVLNWIREPIEWFDSYAEAYHSAARVLFAKSSQTELRDVGACPVVFLYRHSLELYLKEILIRGQRILRLEGKPFRNVEEILERHGKHRLSRLWEDFKELHGQIDWQWDAELDELGKITKEFDSIDPGSFGFRYPVTKSGDDNLKQNFRFDLKHFCERMDEVIEKLDGVSCAMAGVFDQMSQIENA